ncbi:hypothetical protein B0I35DRAFT_415915 [Stachybotrys elegans]|uniref:polynucleotide adenylyltransferase n=1 Tax=Stachybotrys elegans TaxID=80388 RepID=A0A8K0SZP4_9HYPO|nr:hypothetical protein B0I35DRAFT_415915 [Stachybotrys elegans]
MDLPTESSWPMSPTSHDTALCLIPPEELWEPIDRIRSLYDKAHGRWPPHVNLIYPFVEPETLSEAARILSKLDLPEQAQRRVHLQVADAFAHKHHNTIILRPENGPDAEALLSVQQFARETLGMRPDTTSQPHMTLGQTDGPGVASAPHHFLLEKARLSSPVSWRFSRLAILVRESGAENPGKPRRMMLWGYVDLDTHQVLGHDVPRDLYADLHLALSSCNEAQPTANRLSYAFSRPDGVWQSLCNGSILNAAVDSPDRLIVASYNVLAEFEWPPSSSRYPALVANILSKRAAADIVVLQEVTDHFLSFLLTDKEISAQYPFCSHGPPEQEGVGPMGSFLNTAVLSRYRFSWEYLPFHRKHKGSQVATFPDLKLGTNVDTAVSKPLVLATCHLSKGLVDGSVAAKKSELQRLLAYLQTHWPSHPWIIAGDFNLATSSYTISQARQKQELSQQGYRTLRDIPALLRDAGLQDAWLSSRMEAGESSGIEQHGTGELHEGEQGATFDPTRNALAAKMVGSGYNNRPQRYDRILVGNHLQLRPSGFNIFGNNPSAGPEHAPESYASDHWGIRCLLTRPSTRMDLSGKSGLAATSAQVTVELKEAPASLKHTDEILTTLSERGCWQTDADREARQVALKTLEQVLLGKDAGATGPEARATLDIVLVPVGSFGLGTWTAWSDVDCLCIGTISSRTFFTLATQRLKKASASSIVILRRVRASSGTMLELSVRGIKFDLQYCAARSIQERWPEVMRRPPSDPAFALPFQTLSKLKPARDMYYLQRSIPDMTQYRMAHMLIKTWARSRGLYAARFGLLGGIHIATMLVPICKQLAHDSDEVDTADILTTFFNHYANLDWAKQVVFDPFFHKELKYHRGFREPMCLLGWHAPSLNTALNASGPTTKTISHELARASRRLAKEGMTWDAFLGSDGSTGRAIAHDASAEFLLAYKSYVKLEAHYWGKSPMKLTKLLGWLESRCVSVLVDIDKRVPQLAARIWPERFLLGEVDTDVGDTAEAEYHGCYLIGLDWHAGVPDGELELQSVQATLETILQSFEARLRESDKYYDANTCWVSAATARSAEVTALKVDRRQWEAGDIDSFGNGDSEDESDVDEEEEEDAGEDGEEGGYQQLQDADIGSTNNAATVQKGKKKNKLTTASVPRTGKFRTAANVMSRIRWDASMDASNYVVGYEDRFSGAQEKALEDWKSEQTDEEFIPQHRILYFKRRSDRVIVWERRTRLDNVFGSGVTSRSIDAGATTER